MNRLAAILPVEHILIDADITSKKRAFEEIGFLLENHIGLKRLLVSDSLFVRERLGSTGLGHGIAVPHGRIEGLKQPQAALLRLRKPIGFDALDGQPVQLIIGLLIPQNNAEQHLEILSDIVRIVGQADMRERIAAAPDVASLLDLLQSH